MVALLAVALVVRFGRGGGDSAEQAARTLAAVPVEAVSATLQSDRAAQELAQTQLDYARIVAPFDGIAGAPLAWPGTQISTDSTNLVVLNQVEPVRVAFNIPEDSLPAVRAALISGALAVQVTVSGDQARRWPVRWNSSTTRLTPPPAPSC